MDKKEKENIFQKKFIKKYNVEPGTKMTIIYNNEKKDVIVNWMNPETSYFGSNEIKINPENILSIDGKDVSKEIKKLRGEILKGKTKPIKKEEWVHIKTKMRLFKKMHDALSPLVSECKLNFSPKNLNVRSVDPAHVAMVDVTIPKSSFEEYRCNEYREIGFDLDKLHGLLRSWKKEATIDFIDKGEGVRFCGIYEDALGKFNRSFKTMDPAGMPDPKMPNLDLPLKFNANPKGVLKFLDQAEQVSDHIAISGDKEGIRFYAESDIDSVDFYPESLDIFDVEGSYKSLFSIDYFTNAVKPMKIFKTINFQMGTDNPIRITGKDDIEIMILLAPRIESE